MAALDLIKERGIDNKQIKVVLKLADLLLSCQVFWVLTIKKSMRHGFTLQQ